MELRRLVKLWGRYHRQLFRFFFIEDQAAMGGPDAQMEENVRECDVLIMVLYNEEIRPGVMKEYNFGRDSRKPLLLFVEHGFKEKHGEALSRIWQDRSPTPPGIETRGASKSAVSRRFVAATSEDAHGDDEPDLSALALCAMIIDGIHMGEHLVVDRARDRRGGRKARARPARRCDGKRDGRARRCIADLVARGVRTDRSMLFVDRR